MIISVLAAREILKTRQKKIARFTDKKHPEFVGVFCRIVPPVAHAYISCPNALSVFANGVLKPAVLFFRFFCFSLIHPSAPTLG